MGVIYKITSPSNRTYVGKTYDLRKRKNAHKAAVKRGSKNILHNSIRKYGWENHVLEIIEEVEDAILDDREIYWIKELNTYCYENPMGLNMTRGGDGQRSTWMHQIERRKWFSERFTGAGGPFYGKKHTDETKKIMSEKAYKRSMEKGTRIPEWGAIKGREKVQRAILCYNNKGIFISEHVSAAIASRVLKVHRSSIVESCNGVITGVIGKYVFRYKTENYPIKLDIGEVKAKTERRPVVLLTPDLEIAIEFPSALEASEFLDIPKTTINRAAQYNFCHPIRTGHIFLYRDDYDELFEEAA